MEPPAFGPKTKMMEQKVFLKVLKMFSGSMMTLITHGINAGSKEDKPDEVKVKAREKEKEKAEVAEDFSDQEGKAKAEEKAALTWWGKKDMMMIGKMKMNETNMKVFGQKIKTGTMPIGAQNKYTTRMGTVCSREKEKEKERKERKARKEGTMKEKAKQEMAKESQTMYSHPLYRINPFRMNHNRFIIQLLQHRAQGMVLFPLLKLTQYVLM